MEFGPGWRVSRYNEMTSLIQKKQIPILCGAIDWFISITLVLVFSALAGHWPWELMTIFPGFLLSALLLSLIAGYRGFVDTRRVIAGDPGLFRPAQEGFIIGFFPIPIINGIGILQEALAAGPPWPGIGYSPISEWLKYILYTFCWSAVTGMIGAIYGIFLARVNRTILKRIEYEEHKPR